MPALSATQPSGGMSEMYGGSRGRGELLRQDGAAGMDLALRPRRTRGRTRPAAERHDGRKRHRSGAFWTSAACCVFLSLGTGRVGDGVHDIDGKRRVATLCMTGDGRWRRERPVTVRLFGEVPRHESKPPTQNRNRDGLRRRSAPADARPSAFAAAGRLPTATIRRRNSYTASGATTSVRYAG